MAAKFKKKPVEIEAMQWDGTLSSANEIMEWSSTNMGPRVVYNSFTNTKPEPHLNIFTMEGIMVASKNDWIIRGIHGEIYPCNPDIFEKTYAPSEEETGRTLFASTIGDVVIQIEEGQKPSNYIPSENEKNKPQDEFSNWAKEAFIELQKEMAKDK